MLAECHLNIDRVPVKYQSVSVDLSANTQIAFDQYSTNTWLISFATQYIIKYQPIINQVLVDISTDSVDQHNLQ